MCDLICAAEKLIKSGNKSHNEVRILKKNPGILLWLIIHSISGSFHDYKSLD